MDDNMTVLRESEHVKVAALTAGHHESPFPYLTDLENNTTG
jgi:hypothetical protein